MSAVYQMIRFVTHLEFFKFVHSDNSEQLFKWACIEKHQKAFHKANEAIRPLSGLTHFRRQLDMKPNCDAYREGLPSVFRCI